MAKRLPVEFLRRFGLRSHGRNKILIPYGRRGGKSCARSRIRYCRGEQKFSWGCATRVAFDKHGNAIKLSDGRVQVDRPEIVPYGLWHLDNDLFRDYCILGEGESDAWACWFHEVPYLGIPGAQNHRCLQAEHVAEIPKLYIWQEPGLAGQQFVENLNGHLRNSLDFQGDVRVIHIDDVKDPSDLHIEDADGFVERMQAAMRDARLLSKLPRRTASKAPRVPVVLSGPRRYTLDELITQDLGPQAKRGFWLCPFHDDRVHPNLTTYVIDGKQRFRCQCCGVGGDDIEWLRRMHNMSFRQACEHLGLELPDWKPTEVDLSQLLENFKEPAPPEPTEPDIDLSDWRQQMTTARLESVNKPGIYLDRSPTGAGKTHADIQLCEAAGTSLTIVPSHANCQETELLYREHGLDAAAYPPLDKYTCQNLAEATRAQACGLGMRVVVCPRCQYLDGCRYHELMDLAEQAPHRIATHKRAQLTTKGLARNRKVICVHEDAASILRPVWEADRGFHDVSQLVHLASKDASYSEDDLRWFFHEMEKLSDHLDELTLVSDVTAHIDFNLSVLPPQHYQNRLWYAMQENQVDVWPPAMQVVLAMMARGGSPFVQVDADLSGHLQRTIVLVSCIDLGKRRVIWFEDATASRTEIETLVRQPVYDMTPSGRLTHRRPILQFTRDIKQSTSKKTVLNLLRGLLYLLPRYERIGLIAHRYHLALVPLLDEPLRNRIRKTSYFRSGDTRGSNDWHRTCDLLIALGTPRVPVAAVRRRLLQQGEREAAVLADGDWQSRVWTGFTPTRERCEIMTKQYANDKWRQACEMIVLAELQQCIGRGRGVLEAGIPVVVLSNEPLGLPLATTDVSPVNEAESKILGYLNAATGSEKWGETLNNILEFHPTFSPREIAAATKLSKPYVNDRLKSLRSRGLVEHGSNPRGWSLPRTPPLILEEPPIVLGNVQQDTNRAA